MGLRQALWALLTDNNGQDTEPADRDTPDAESTETEPVNDTSLMHCPACETTFLNPSSETCPQCGEPLGSIPTGRELGMR